MCTALVSISADPDVPVLLLGTRDEFTDRRWIPPARWWRGAFDGVLGGYDVQAGGTWLAVHPERRLVAMVLNGPDAAGPVRGGRSRGRLPLITVTGGDPFQPALLRSTRPFHLLRLSLAGASLGSWDGRTLRRQEIGPGVHVVGNTGLDRQDDSRTSAALRWLGERPRPKVDRARPAEECWGPWLSLLGREPSPDGSGDGIVVREAHGDRIHATLAVSAVALSPRHARYDFGQPLGTGTFMPLTWRRVL